MASSGQVCGPCEFRHVSKTADVWCSDCDEGFCTDCNDQVHSAKLTRNHWRTLIEDYQKLPTYILEIEQICREHDDKFVLFCNYHDSPCCRQCVIQNHKQCKDISNIEEVVQNVKTSNVFQETEQMVIELVENIAKIKKDREENLQCLENSKYEVNKQIENFRIKLNKHLDKLQEDVIEEINRTNEREKEKIKIIIEDLEGRKKDMNEIKENIHNIKQYASELQAYLAMKKIQKDFDKSETAVDLLAKSGNLQQNVLSLEINAAMKNILTSVKQFGNIIVESKGCNVVLTKKKNQQAQLFVPSQQQINIDDVSLQLQQTLDVNVSNIRGCCVLPDGRFVFTSWNVLNKKIGLMNADGTKNTTFQVPSPSFDVIYVKYNNSLAISCCDQCITFIDLNSYTVKEKKLLNISCYGLAAKNTSLYFSEENSIQVFNLKDKSIKTFSYIKQGCYSYIEIFENNLYHTNNITNTITCYDLNSGGVKWEFKDESILKQPAGISVDSRGNVYIAGYGTCNVVVIFPDGQRCTELLSVKDKLSNPCAIHWDRSTNKLIVANYMNSAYVYSII